MNIRELRRDFENALISNYSREEIGSFFYILTEDRWQMRRVDVALLLEKEVSEKEQLFFVEAIRRLKNSEPIQYILGTTHFYGLDFSVNKHVLIPRPETEELVDWIIKTFSEKAKTQTIKILDIGTGSGCIPISLAKHLKNAEIYALDISKKAIEVASKNAKDNQVQVRFIENDILEIDQLPEMYDCIVSNPPYVRELEKEEMQANVLDNEPHLALFVDNDNPLVFYRKITQLAKQSLKPNGKLFFEINQYLGTETKQMILDYGFEEVVLKKDINGNDRMIRSVL